jgi:hypothetical protein
VYALKGKDSPGAGQAAAKELACGEVSDEGSIVSEKDLREMQDRATPRRRAGDLRESQAQAAAGMRLETGNRKIEAGWRVLSDGPGKLSEFLDSIFQFLLAGR